jgi:hypothetical protein
MYRAPKQAFSPARFIAETFSGIFPACASHIAIPPASLQGFAKRGMDIAKLAARDSKPNRARKAAHIRTTSVFT